MNRLIRTLVVDDSAFVRKVVREMLSRSPFIEVVGAARDGEEALEMAEQLKPDVITCDLQMPRKGGVEFVREQMARRPLPILILTASAEDAEGTLEAMNAGAVDFVQKPTALANDELLDVRDSLIEKVKEAARSNVSHLPETRAMPATDGQRLSKERQIDVVVIGISTGGPQALRFLLPQFPADFPVPIAIVIHMPLGYTQLFAQKLSEISQIQVKEARDGDVLTPGMALIAPAGRHMHLRRKEGQVRAAFTIQPLDLPHRPAADVLFQSAAETFGARTLGVVMTGMGYDGKQGSAWIKAQGGKVLTEAEQSCVIYGMPRAVVEAGLSDKEVSLNDMAQAIMDHV